MNMKTRPTGITVLAILTWIGAFFMLLGGIALLVLGSLVLPSIPLIGGLGIIGGIIYAAFTILAFFMGKGLWSGKNWARILMMVFSSLGILSGVFVLVGGLLGSGLFYIILNGLIIWYLGFNENVKAYFM